jgi:hypothetical protein
MSSESTQSGNPHKLTKKQHVFPTASIARFVNKSGVVSVIRKPGNDALQLRPSNAMFCAKRVWNQSAEIGYMKSIEDKFQTFAERVLCGHTKLTEEEQLAISRFYALCRLRSEVRDNPPGDLIINGAQPATALDTNTEEILESNGYVFARGNMIPGRHIAAIRIQILIGRTFPQNTKWGIIQSSEVEFLVPDSFKEIGVVPLTPNACFVANSCGGMITAQNAMEINAMACDVASSYYFAKDLSKAMVGGICGVDLTTSSCRQSVPAVQRR